jgi:prepilin-type N-terminal cleavage/methylation domain-containing protein
LRGRPGDLGFTLIELLVVITVLPIVVGGVTIAVITTLNDERGLSTKLADSHNAQFTANYYVRDVQTAQRITTGPTIPLCGTTGTQVLGLEWQPTPATTTFVSYVYVTTSTREIIRNFCSSPASTPTTSVVSHNASTTIPPNPSQPTLASSSCPSSANSSLVPSFCWKTVTLLVTEQSGFTYSLTASPRRPPPGGGGTSTVTAPSLLLLGSGTNLNCSGSGAGGLAVNGLAAMDSTSPGSVVLGKNETFGASSVYSPEGSSAVTSGPGNGTYTSATTQPYSTGPPIPDPYSDLPDPSPTNDPTYSTIQSSTSSLLGGPGIYTNPVSITTAQTNIPSGIYIFEKGLSISGNSSTTVTSGPGGVLFYIGIPNASPSTAQTALYGVAGSGTLTLNAMTTGPYAGVVLFQSRTDSNLLSISGNGSTTALTYGGVVYAPDAQVQTAGNGTTLVSGVISASLQCGGNGAVSIGPKAISPTMTITSSQNPAQSGQPITFTTTVSDPVNGYTPTGSMTFTANGSPIPGCSSVPLNNGQAQCTTSALIESGSPYAITATFTPPSGTITYATTTVTMTPSQVVGLASTGTTLVASINPSTINQAVTYTATVNVVAPGTGAPTGFVEFFDNGTPIASCGGATGAALNGATPDTATCAVTYTAGGVHSITASYLGSTNYKPSGSNTVMHSVGPQISNFTVTGSAANHTETFTGNTNENTGTVTIYVCNNTSGTVTACSATSPTLVKTYTITIFSGSSPSWTFTWTTAANELTKNTKYLAQVSQVDGASPPQPSLNSPTFAFTGK